MLNESAIAKTPIMNEMKNWVLKKLAGNNDVTKAKLEAARKRKFEITQTKDMERGQMSKIDMREKVDDKIK